MSFEPFLLLTGLKGCAFSALTLGGRGAVAAAYLDGLQRAAVLVGIVVGAAVDAALDAGVKSFLVHNKKPPQFKPVRIGLARDLRAPVVWTISAPVIPARINFPPVSAHWE